MTQKALSECRSCRYSDLLKKRKSLPDKALRNVAPPHPDIRKDLNLTPDEFMPTTGWSVQLRDTYDGIDKSRG